QPETRERLPGGGLALRDFVLVVGKRKIGPAGVDVKRLAQILHGHHRALEVPARPAGSEGAVPVRLAFLGGLPEHEVARIGFVILVGVHAGPGANPREVDLRELSVVLELLNPKVDRAFALALAPVSIAL